MLSSIAIKFFFRFPSFGNVAPIPVVIEILHTESLQTENDLGNLKKTKVGCKAYFYKARGDEKRAELQVNLF